MAAAVARPGNNPPYGGGRGWDRTGDFGTRVFSRYKRGFGFDSLINYYPVTLIDEDLCKIDGKR